MACSGTVRERHVLDNGLAVVAENLPGASLFTATLALEAGSRYDPEERAGLASLAGSLLEEAMDSRDGTRIEREIDSIGATLETVTGYETVRLSVTGISGHLDSALSVMSELVAFPVLEDQAVEDARRKLIADILDGDDEPYQVCRREFFDAVFVNHPRHRPVVGHVDTVSAIDLGDVLSFVRDRYSPAKGVLGLAGDIPTGHAIEIAARRFGAWRGAGAADPVVPLPQRQREVRRRLVRMDREQVHVSLGHLGLCRMDPRYLEALVVDVVLGDSAGFASRLGTRLRERSGLAYQIESDTAGTAGRDPGVFWVYTATSPEHLDAMVDGILDEMGRIVSESLGQDEVRHAVDYLKGRLMREGETTEQKAARLVTAERFDLGLDYDERYAGALDLLSPDSVFEAARTLIDHEHYSIAMVGPV